MMHFTSINSAVQLESMLDEMGRMNATRPLAEILGTGDLKLRIRRAAARKIQELWATAWARGAKSISDVVSAVVIDRAQKPGRFTVVLVGKGIRFDISEPPEWTAPKVASKVEEKDLRPFVWTEAHTRGALPPPSKLHRCLICGLVAENQVGGEWSCAKHREKVQEVVEKQEAKKAPPCGFCKKPSVAVVEGIPCCVECAGALK